MTVLAYQAFILLSLIVVPIVDAVMRCRNGYTAVVRPPTLDMNFLDKAI